MMGRRETAMRRLQRDLLEWRENSKHFLNIGACPLEEDMTNWHFNMVVGDVAMHGQIRFPESYPFDPPRVSFFGDVPHRQISFNRSHGLGYLCLDMLQHKTSGYYQGWSSSYSVVSVIAQMETLLHRLGKNQLPRTWQTFSCGICGHCGDDPQGFFPELPKHAVVVAGKRSSRSGKGSIASRGTRSMWWKLNRDVESVIFGYLSQSDLGYLVFVNVHLQQALYHSRVYHNRMVTCFHSHEHFGDFLEANRERRESDGAMDVAAVRGHMFGIGFGVEYWENENSRTGRVTRKLKDLNIVPDVLSFGAFCQGVRLSMWREDRFEEFLPLYLNNEHGRMALDLAEKVIEKVHRDEQSRAVGFEPVMALKFLSKVMNTTVVRLMKEVEENGDSSIPLFTSIKALQSYMYCYHLLLGFAKRYPSIVEHAREKMNEFVFAPHRRDKQHFPDLGELVIYLTIVPMSWSVFGPVMIEEGLCRNAKWILEACPWLIQTDKNIHVSCVRLRQSFEVTMVSKRLHMFQFYFLEKICGVGKSHVEFELAGKLKEMNACLGQVEESVAVGLQRRCRRIFQVDDWLPFFKLIQLPCPSARRLSHDLREAMLESERKGYQRFVKINLDVENESQTAHEDADLCLCSGQIRSLESRVTGETGVDTDEKETAADESKGGRRSLDIAFCVDCTGSMSSYLDSVKVHIAEIASKLDEEENVNVQFAMVGYRDHNGEAGNWAPNVTKVADFSKLSKFTRELQQFAVGGGCDVEAVADGWHDVLGLKWRRMSVKAVIQVADIGCHGLTREHDVCPLGHDPMALARQMLERDITLYNVGCTMRGWQSEQFFRGTAHMTGGLYLTLENARKLPQVILESTKEGLSLTKIIPRVFDLMTKCREKNPCATRDQLGYLVWRELVERGVQTKKVSCVDVGGSKVSDCVVEISEANTLADVRSILVRHGGNAYLSDDYYYYGRQYQRNAPLPSSSVRSYDEFRSEKKRSDRTSEKERDGRLITLEQTMRCMNRAEQMGNRLEWMKHGCVYRMSKYLREASEKRFVDYGVQYRGKMRRIPRHKFGRGMVVELTDFKSKRVYFGKVLGRDESKFSMNLRVDGLRGSRTVALTSRNICKSGTLLKKFGRDGIVDPHFKEMEQWWKKRKIEEEERQERKEEAKEIQMEEPAVRVEKASRVPINAWATQKKTIATTLAKSSQQTLEVQSSPNPASKAESLEEEENQCSQVLLLPNPQGLFEACELSQGDMVVRSMLAILPPKKICRGIDSIRQVYDSAYSRWMPNIPLLFPFVDPRLFGRQEANLESVFSLCRMGPFLLEMYEFGLVDRVPTDRDVDPVVSVCLKMRGVALHGRRSRWENLVDCLCMMYPNVSDRLVNAKPQVIVGRVPRSRARQLVRELEAEWNQRRLLPVQFEVDGLALMSRRGNGMSARFDVDKVVSFSGAHVVMRR